MKTILAAMVLFMGFSATAAGAKYFCKERVEFERRTVVLTQDNDLNVEEGEKTPFTLELYDGYTKMAQLVVKGTVVTEDVNFVFTSKDRKVSFQIFMDELDQSSLTWKGQKGGTAHFECN